MSEAVSEAAPQDSELPQADPGVTEPEITPEIVKEHGLSPDEYDRILRALNRTPTMTELGVYSVMWSEHCSYKSSRVWLKQLPTTGEQVICGPGENAGIVDVGNGLAAVFKMESHNHPSFIEPYQGAATGVGGIMRDVFTMGARPVANLNALRFGAPEHEKTRHLVDGVVSGIGGYGNCFGVPTVGGEVEFDPAYNGNILVNAMCVGLAPADNIFYAAASGVGNPRSSMWAPRPVATAFTVPPWRRPNSTTTARRSARRCRWAIRSRKSCCSKPASNSWRKTRSSPFRTWAPRASHRHRSRWPARAMWALNCISMTCPAAKRR